MSGFYRSAAVQPVVDAWLDFGGVPSELLDELGVSEVAMLDPCAWIARGACFRLANELSARSGDANIGLHLAEQVNWRTLGCWASQIVSAPTLGRALWHASRKLGLLETPSQLEVLADHDRSCLVFTYEPPFEDRPDQFLFADLLTMKRIFSFTAEPVAVSVRTVLGKPRDADEVIRLLGSDIEFDAPANELVFDTAALSVPMRDDAREFSLNAAQGGDKCRTAHDVASVIGRRLEYEPLTISLVAGQLGMNVRTVQRHLGLWNISFEALLDQYRRQHALELLLKQRRPVTDVAFRLGYSDAGHFSRAFKRWFGVPPSHCNEILIPLAQPEAGSLPADF